MICFVGDCHRYMRGEVGRLRQQAQAQGEAPGDEWATVMHGVDVSVAPQVTIPAFQIYLD